MNSIWLRILPYIAALTLVAGALFGAYHHGLAVKDAEWQSAWSARDTQDAKARDEAEKAARATELANQNHMDKVQSDANQKLEQARIDAAGANTAADGLRRRVQKLLDASSARSNTGTGSSCSTATRPGNLLAVVLDKSVQRNRELAEIADTARVRGQACEAAYNSLQSEGQ